MTPDEFIASLPDARAQDAAALDDLFRRATGWQPRMWGGKLIGYRQYHYRYASAREGDFLATGFSPLASKISLHILPGYTDFPQIAARLGPHKRGKSCWYIKRLADVDPDALADLIRAGLEDLRGQWAVEAT